MENKKFKEDKKYLIKKIKDADTHKEIAELCNAFVAFYFERKS